MAVARLGRYTPSSVWVTVAVIASHARFLVVSFGFLPGFVRNMRIMTLNCNGVRAAERRGLFDWLQEREVDIVCLQETKAQEWQLAGGPCMPSEYHCYYFDAQRKGYAGTAILSRQRPDRVIKGMGWPPADSEGRFLQADFGDLSVISLYLPSGASGEARQQIKFECLDVLWGRLVRMAADGRRYVICGDWNMCHQQIDLKNWKGNLNRPGFMPAERAWLDRLFAELGYVDAFRLLHTGPDHYTWWSNRGQARANNTGWRIDYHVITQNLVPYVNSVRILKECNFSDHAPVVMDLGDVLDTTDLSSRTSRNMRSN